MPTTILFENPYADVPKTHRTRTTIDLATADKSFMDSLHGRSGTMQTTINILVSKAINELKRIGFGSYDPDRYEYAIAHCAIVLGVRPDEHAAGRYGPVPGAVPVPRGPAHDLKPHDAALGHDDGRAAIPMAHVPEGATQPAVTSSPPKSAKGGKGVRRAKG